MRVTVTSGSGCGERFIHDIVEGVSLSERSDAGDGDLWQWLWRSAHAARQSFGGWRDHSPARHITELKDSCKRSPCARGNGCLLVDHFGDYE